MSSTFETILDAVAVELAQFDFKTVAKGWTFDQARALPACLVLPRAKERRPHSHFADIDHYCVALVIEMSERNSAQLLADTLEMTEQIQSHFHHKIFDSVSGHIDTQAKITHLSESGGNRVDYARPVIELAVEVVEEI